MMENEGVDSGEKRKTTKTMLDPQGRLLRNWNKMFVISCAIAVEYDPLFFYVPVIDEDKKCVAFDRRIKIIALCFRSVTDAIFLANIILQFVCPYIDEAARKLGRTVVVTDAWLIAKRYMLSWSFLIDTLAILPLPQVLVPIIFSQTRGSEYLDTRKVVNAVVLLQYVPRVLRIYLSWMRLVRTGSKLVRLVWVKAGFNLFLYILASHVLGAFWYLFSIERQTVCWHIACKNHIGCTRRSYICDHSSANYRFLNDHCPIETPNTKLFDFGIFLQALQSGTVSSKDIPKKIMYCFWWGLRNLSSVGQNLQTSTNFWENFFAVSISIFGLLLFLYFVGNVQTYIQLATEKWEEITQKMKVKERDIDLWISRNKLCDDVKRQIMSSVQQILKEKTDFDAENPLPHLPIELKKEIKRDLCLPLLKKVPMLTNKTERLLLLICDYLKPVYYNERSYIVREGEPLDAMLFITQGILWNFTTSINGEGAVSLGAECIEKGHFIGEELLDWGFRGFQLPNLSHLPVSTKTVKTHTKVEAFALMADDLKTLVSNRRMAISGLIEHVQRRRLNAKKNENSTQMA